MSKLYAKWRACYDVMSKGPVFCPKSAPEISGANAPEYAGAPENLGAP